MLCTGKTETTNVRVIGVILIKFGSIYLLGFLGREEQNNGLRPAVLQTYFLHLSRTSEISCHSLSRFLCSKISCNTHLRQGRFPQFLYVYLNYTYSTYYRSLFPPWMTVWHPLPLHLSLIILNHWNKSWNS